MSRFDGGGCYGGEDERRRAHTHATAAYRATIRARSVKAAGDSGCAAPRGPSCVTGRPTSHKHCRRRQRTVRGPGPNRLGPRKLRACQFREGANALKRRLHLYSGRRRWPPTAADTALRCARVLSKSPTSTRLTEMRRMIEVSAPPPRSPPCCRPSSDLTQSRDRKTAKFRRKEHWTGALSIPRRPEWRPQELNVR